MRRQLSQSERNIVDKSMRRMKKELENLNYLMDYHNLLINTGLYQNYLKELEKFKNQRQEVLNDITTIHHNLAVLQEQLDKGVEVKEKKSTLGVN